MIRFLILSSLAIGSVYGDIYSNVIIDWYCSPYVGAEDLLSAHRGLEFAEDWLIKPSVKPKKGFWAGMGRFAELFLFWDPVNGLAQTTQHEVFGHGFRLRTLSSEGAEVKAYKIQAPFPYGYGGGATRFKVHKKSTTTFEDLAMASGGIEATAILANRLKLQWLQRGTIDPRESSLYTGSEQDLSEYIWASSDKDKDSEGDISYYVHHLNRTYPKSHLTVRSLKKQALVNLVDPFTWYSLYTWWRYVFRGKSMGIPMIPIGSYKYLPGARLGLTPFGPEYYLENFLVKNKEPIYFYLRGGGYAHQAYVGFGVEHAYLWQIESLPWGLRLDSWYQPHTAFRNKRYSLYRLKKERHFHKQPHNPQLGIALSVIGHKRFWSRGAFYFQIGGKTIGFLEGEPLQPAAIARIGFTFW